MNVKTQLRIIVILLFFIASTTIVVTSTLVKNYYSAIHDLTFVNNITLEVFSRRLIADDYLTNHTDRARVQWYSIEKTLEGQISANKLTIHNQQEAVSLNELKTSFRESRDVFNEAVKFNQLPNRPLHLQQQQQELFASLLTAKSQATILIASDLYQLNEREATQLLQEIVLLLASASALFLSLLLISFWLLWKNINQLDREKSKLEVLLETLPVGVSLIKVPSGKGVLLNKAGVKLLGRGFAPDASKEDYGKVYDISKADGTPYPTEEQAPVVAMNTGKSVTKDDVFITKPTGEKIQLRVTSLPLQEPNGKMLNVLSIFQDITKEKEVDRMKTEFISLVSHQLRTPLSAMRAFLEMLLTGDAGKLSAEQTEMISSVDQSNERMIQLVNSLLNVSRMESGRIVVDPKPTDLKELIEGVVAEVKNKLDEKKQKLAITVPDSFPKINLDQQLIRQVYMNLLTNAIKYTPTEGKISITLSKKDEHVISEVKDTGYGIPAKDHDKVFQKFYRGDNIVRRQWAWDVFDKSDYRIFKGNDLV